MIITNKLIDLLMRLDIDVSTYDDLVEEMGNKIDNIAKELGFVEDGTTFEVIMDILRGSSSVLDDCVTTNVPYAAIQLLAQSICEKYSNDDPEYILSMVIEKYYDIISTCGCDPRDFSYVEIDGKPSVLYQDETLENILRIL